MKLFITYFIISVIFELFAIYFGWKSLKKKMAGNPMISMAKASILSLASGQLLKKKLISIPIIAVVFIALLIAAPIIFPFSLFSKIKKLIFGKSKLEKQAEAEGKAQEEAYNKSQEWLKNEGDIFMSNSLPGNDTE